MGDIAMVQVAAALAILERRKIVLRGTAARAPRQFIDAMEATYRITEIQSEIIKTAADLVQKHPLKAYDAVHLAPALETQQQLTETGLEITFVSGDQRLLDAARAEGLAVENPFTYAHLDAPQ